MNHYKRSMKYTLANWSDIKKAAIEEYNSIGLRGSLASALHRVMGHDLITKGHDEVAFFPSSKLVVMRNGSILDSPIEKKTHPADLLNPVNN